MIAFWGVAVAVFFGSSLIPWNIVSKHTNLPLVWTVLREAISSDFSRITTPDFAYALALAVFFGALALAAAFFITHVVWLRLSLWLARRRVTMWKGPLEFAANLELTHQRLEQHPLIGHAWREFHETLVPPEDGKGVVRNTVRPQAFINTGIAREHFMGMKILPTVPGYFVGLGLLLTFIGLVLALSKASGGSLGGSAAEMTQSLSELLNAATFKFSTSIAGLFSSLLLSLLFKIYGITIESGFERFCQELERRLIYMPPQSVTVKIQTAMEAQVTELKEINSEKFFGRLGAQVAPAIEQAIKTPLSAMAEMIDETLTSLKQTSQTGTQDLITTAMNHLREGAGTEMREMAGALKETREALAAIKDGLTGSGEELRQRVTDASRGAQEAVSAASQQLGEVMQSNTKLLQGIISSLDESFERARGEVESGMAQAARGAAEAVRKGMEDGLGDFVGKMRQDVDRLCEALQAGQDAFRGQAESIRAATAEARETATEFGKIAADVSGASRPLTESSIRIADATKGFEGTIKESVSALQASQEAASELALKLQNHIDNINQVWSGYEERFEKVDRDLGTAADQFAKQVVEQQQLVRDFAIEIDKGCKEAVDKLAKAASALTENTEELIDGFESVTKTFTSFELRWNGAPAD